MHQTAVRAVKVFALVAALPGMLTLGGADVAAAQVRGIPVYNGGVPRGIALYGDVGFPNEDAGNGTAFAVTGKAGFGVLGVTAIVSRLNADDPFDDVTSVGGTLNLRLFGGPLIPLSITLQGGVGYEDAEFLVGGDVISDGSFTRFPVGLGVALVIPNPALAIRPWLAPRLNIERLSAGGGSTTETDFGISGGVELNLLNGLGFHAAYDWVSRGSLKPATFGVGAHYAFRVPGL